METLPAEAAVIHIVKPETTIVSVYVPPTGLSLHCHPSHES